MKKFILALLICAGTVQAQSLIVISGSKTVAVPGTVVTPSFAPAGGTYSSTQTVTISTTTPLAVLCYTTDGSTPTEVSHLCSGGTTSTYSTPITVSTTHTVKAIGTLATYTDSAVASATYTIGATAPTYNSVPFDAQSSGSKTITTGSISCASGDSLLIAGFSNASTDTFTLSTSTGNTLTSEISNYTQSGGSNAVALWYVNCNGTAGTYTLNTGTYNWPWLVIYHANNGHFDVANACGATSGSYAPSCSITATANGLGVNFLFSVGTATVPVTGWTTRLNATYMSAFDQSSTSGTVNFPSTWGAGANSYNIVVNLKP